jgi:hypothetical protein
VAKNEAIFRVINQRMARWEELHADEDLELYVEGVGPRQRS